jgi:hypothetical protein
VLEAMRDALREHYRDIARKTEYREYFAHSSSLTLIYSVWIWLRTRALPWHLGVLLTSATLLSTVLCLSFLSLLSYCIAGYTLSLVIHRIQSEIIIWKP